MPDRESKPTEQKLQEAKQQVTQLEHEVNNKKPAKDTSSDPVEGLKQKANAVVDDGSKAPNRGLRIALIAGVLLLLFVLLLFVLVSRVFIWLLVLLVLAIILLTGR